MKTPKEIKIICLEFSLGSAFLNSRIKKTTDAETSNNEDTACNSLL